MFNPVPRLAGLVAVAATSVLAINHTISTSNGLLKGVPSEFRPNVTVYMGIPFAAPPVADLRWAAPEPAANWSGVLVADNFGPQCAQTISSAGIFSSGKDTESEDCLYLNIWTPTFAENETIADANLPVYFWIYGGRFEGGSGDVITYDGTGLASKGVIVVTINYRLGPFGFLAHPELDAESGHNSSGNYGLLDQHAALKWVRENIAQFGGNGSHITVGGQSAGSASALDVMYSPLTRGWAVGIIAESGARGPKDPLTGSLATSYRNKTDALAEGVAFLADDLNVSTIAEARKLSTATLLDYDALSQELFEGTSFENVTVAFTEPPLWRPVIDHYVLTKGYGEALLTGDHDDIPILTGNNADESGAATDPGLTLETYGEFAEMWEDLADDFYALYPANTTDEANNASNNFFRDLSRVSTWTWAQDWAAGGAKSDVFIYFFNHTPPENAADGAYHGSELWYTFNNIPYANYSAVTWTDYDYYVEDRMSSYWANFIKTGNPNAGNLTDFAPWSNESYTTTALGNTWGTLDLTPTEAKRELILQWLSVLFQW